MMIFVSKKKYLVQYLFSTYSKVRYNLQGTKWLVVHCCPGFIIIIIVSQLQNFHL